MHSPKFTIALAGYNCAPFLAKSLGSIAAQTFRDFEAILYVEESTDDSLAICRDFAARDSRATVVSRPKSGAVSATRNYAIANAAGEFLVFLDGDDWLAPDALEKIASRLAASPDLDLLAFAAVTTESEDPSPADVRRLSNFSAADARGTFSGKDALRRAKHGGQFHNFTPMAAYRTSFLRSRRLMQSEGFIMEDLGWTPRVWFCAGKMAYLDETLYTYRRRAGSITTQGSPKILFHLAWQIRTLLDFVASEDVPPDIMRIWANQWLAILFWFMFHPITSRKFSDADRRRALADLIEGDGLPRLRRLVAMASATRRLAFPLVLLAAKGWVFPARFFFRRLYYPLCSRTRR